LVFIFDMIDSHRPTRRNVSHDTPGAGGRVL
jgi:hypothetical protein